jgi:hypothetical protein
MYLLHWLQGLKRLGHRVLFIEFLKEDPGAAKQAMLRYFHEVMAAWWHPEQAALIVEATGESLYGPNRQQVAQTAREAAALITLAACYRKEPYPFIGEVRPRILIEQDPGYTHLWAAEGDPAKIFGQHDIYYTVGGNIGSCRCSLPTLGIPWRRIWNPVVLDGWPPGTPVQRDRFTTVADWRGYGYLVFARQVIGPKAEEFRKFIDLPGRVGEPIELALTIDPEDPDLAYLRRQGWRVESTQVVATPAAYQEYVTGSLGEFSCAKGGYVGTRCGWFSDRSACYLAAGRPVVLQATGFEDLLPTGQGLFAVADVGEAAEAIRAIRQDYARHARAARSIAQEYFDSDKVLGRLLDEVGIERTAPRTKG